MKIHNKEKQKILYIPQSCNGYLRTDFLNQLLGEEFTIESTKICSNECFKNLKKNLGSYSLILIEEANKFYVKSLGIGNKVNEIIELAKQARIKTVKISDLVYTKNSSLNTNSGFNNDLILSTHYKNWPFLKKSITNLINSYTPTSSEFPLYSYT
jgi:hypothetical protein